MASLNNPPSDDSTVPRLTNEEDQVSGQISRVPTPPNSSEGPMMCLLWFPVSCASGAAMGAMFGYGAGLLKKRGLKGSLSEVKSHAKTFAIMSGVDQLVCCLLGKLRGKDDAYNAGIAGCCSGLAVSFPGSPKSLIQTCVAYGVLSFLFKGIDISRHRPALAAAASNSTNNGHSSSQVSLHLQFPLPQHLNQAFSSFCDAFKLNTPPLISTATTDTEGNQFSTFQ